MDDKASDSGYGPAGQAGRPSTGVFLENPEDALDEVCVLLERFNDRLTLSNLALAKRYAEGRLNLLIEATRGTVDFNIVFQKVDSFKLRWGSGAKGKRS
ncbi:MAG TPA: hypothetical protein VGA77_09275, partial [Propylenella sp.]